jgi:Xaa-Pro aminopeptidase
MGGLARIERVQRGIGKGALWIENPVDIRYLTEISVSRGLMVVERARAILFVDSRYLDAVQGRSPCEVALWEKGAPGKWLTAPAALLDSAYTPIETLETLRRDYPAIEWSYSPRLLEKARSVKDPSELTALKRAAEVTRLGHQAAEAALLDGATEAEVAWVFEKTVRQAGASRLAFEPIVAFGSHSAFPHHRACKAALHSGEAALIDAGAVVDGYAGDQTRFYPRGFRPLAQWLEWVKAAQEIAAQLAAPGVLVGDLDRAVRDFFRSKGVEELFSHSLGHGIGLETHEFPRLKWDGPDRAVPLAPGMAFTIEPGLYQKGVGGVRWEDVFVVTETGCERC